MGALPKFDKKLKIFKLKKSKSDFVFSALDRIATSVKKVQVDFARQTKNNLNNLQSCYK